MFGHVYPLISTASSLVYSNTCQYMTITEEHIRECPVYAEGHFFHLLRKTQLCHIPEKKMRLMVITLRKLNKYHKQIFLPYVCLRFYRNL